MVGVFVWAMAVRIYLVISSPRTPPGIMEAPIAVVFSAITAQILKFPIVFYGMMFPMNCILDLGIT
jgi:hypothetical protein